MNNIRREEMYWLNPNWVQPVRKSNMAPTYWQRLFMTKVFNIRRDLYDYLLTIIVVLLGLISQFLYWLVFDSFGRYENRSKRKLKCIEDQKDGEYNAIIIGTGFSGIGTAIKLKKHGMNNYILIERHGHVGGTWYANKYPGCACDVPSNLYSYSFEPNPKWSHYFSRQPEIAEYLEYCTDKYNIRRHIQFNTNVTQLKWIEER
ncbi:unnamed protein product, partial [Rotaria sp. Silwood2]